MVLFTDFHLPVLESHSMMYKIVFRIPNYNAAETQKLIKRSAKSLLDTNMKQNITENRAC